ncbi:ferredoxin [Smaragdicoccus niigatensis]|uniref:ferredoxin n=1 Tax=Smaragdicoccus niigatensis TaxID=359359 RepID=UPI00038135E5|nr:ferredoxin [Smaragdicoccus niigatensis]
MKITVDQRLCDAHAMCVALVPSVFGLRADGNAEVLVDDVPSELVDEVYLAIDSCPLRAILIAD